ncbi:MAG: hypothetical protein AAGA66_07540 [Bacteroidota bacterium]
MADITRYDRNLVNNMLDFSGYEKDAVLIKNLVAFFSYDINHNVLPPDLFGKRLLDPVTFAQHMGYKNYRSLIKKHPEPAQFRGKTPAAVKIMKEQLKADNEPSWETELCNAIYRMRYESLRFSKPGKTPDGVQTSELNEIRFLKYAKKFHDPAKRKIYYEIEYDDTYINNLARYFMKYSNQVYAQLRKAKLQDLYIWLANLRDIANKENEPEYSIDTISFDFLCMKVSTNITKPSQKKKYLTNAFKKINGLIGDEIFDLSWKKNGSFYYQPVITFKYTQNELEDHTQESKKRLRLYFKSNIVKEFARKYIRNSSEDDVIKIRNWLRDPGADVALKRMVYASTHIQCFGREADIYSESVNNSMRSLCADIADALLNEVFSSPKSTVCFT